MSIEHIYCINLDRSPDRWEHIQNITNKHKLNIERWSAIDGCKLSDQQLKEYSHPLGYHLSSNSMIAIWLSHYSLWKHIVDNHLDNVLIIEDDVDFIPNRDYR